MKRLTTALLLCSVFVSPALAAEIAANSKIESVVVYPSGATVTRSVAFAAPAGDSVLVLGDFPVTLDVNSLRIEGTGSAGLEIGSIDHEIVEPTSIEAADASGIRAQIRTLRDEIAALDGAIDAARTEKRFIEHFAEVKPQIFSEDFDRERAGIEDWRAAWSTVGLELARVNEAILTNTLRQRELEERIADLEQELAKDPSKDEPHLTLKVNVAAAAELEGNLKIDYRVADARWAPYYDARLDLAAPDAQASLTLVRRAEVSQRSGEDWTDVALTLSTARTLGGTAAPEIDPLLVQYYEPPAPMKVGRGREFLEEMTAQRMEAPAADVAMDGYGAGIPEPALAPVPAAEVEATLDLAGFNAAFAVPGKVTVSTGGAKKSLRLGTTDLTPEVVVRAVPEYDETAYLSAKVKNASGAPLLPGRVVLFRAGAYVGDGRIPFLADGDETTLGFGADDAVVVSRVPMSRAEGQAGILSKKSTDERDYKITVKNLHDRPMKITVVDRIPYTEHEDIVVEQLPATTKPTETDLDDKRGVVAWTADFGPGEEKVYRLAYRVSWPVGKDVIWSGGGYR